jgi:hypothetical protein
MQSADYHYFPPALRVLTLIYLGVLYWSFNLQGLKKCNFPVELILKVRPIKAKSQFRLFFIFCFGVLIPGILTYWVVKDSDYAIHYRHVVSVCFILTFIISIWPTSAVEGELRKRFWKTIFLVTFPTSSTTITFPQVLLADILTSYSRIFGDLVKIIYQIFASFNSDEVTTTTPRYRERETLALINPGAPWPAESEAVSEGVTKTWLDPLQLLTLIFVCLPFFLRFRQCLIEYSQSQYKTKKHLFNAIKYFTAFPVVILSSYVTKNNHLGEQSVWVYLFTNVSWSVKLWLLSILVNSMYSFYWDIYMDWELGQIPSKHISEPNYTAESSEHNILNNQQLLRNSNEVAHNDRISAANLFQRKSTLSARICSKVKFYLSKILFITGIKSGESCHSPICGAPLAGHYTLYSFPYFLRPTLLFEDPLIYYLSIGINFMLRITWTFNLSPHLSLQSAPLAVFLIQWLELTRRWLWVYFRVEREYIDQLRNTAGSPDEINNGATINFENGEEISLELQRGHTGNPQREENF